MRLAILWLMICTLALAGCRDQVAPATPALTKTPTLNPDLGQAPELNNETWLNTPEPLRLADLRGKVVLIDMWTFG